MRGSLIVLIVMSLGLADASAAPAKDCRAPAGAIGLSRTVEIDTRSGPLYGSISKQAREASFLAPKEVVLTFDDGPSPWVTKPILETLARHCTKATFFPVGKMAVAYPAVVRQILDAGHTLGGHTWSHPKNLPGLKPERAIDEIERGFAAIAAASGGDVAPFFRFTGLRDGPVLLGYLQDRGIATFTVDVVSDDSFIADVSELVRVTLSRIAQHQGGILLFHDIKPATAKALPLILDALKADGYTVVHMRPAARLEPKDELVATYVPDVTAKLAEGGTESAPQLMPFFGAVEALRGAQSEESRANRDINLTRLAPTARPRPQPAPTPSPAARPAAQATEAPKKAAAGKPAGSDPSAGWSARALPYNASAERPDAVR